MLRWPVFIVQRVIPHYRVALFEALHREAGLRVLTASKPPGGTFLNHADPHDHVWAVPFPFRFPDPDNPFVAEVPLREILDTFRPNSLICEFGLRLSTTRQLAKARREGRLRSFAYWTHGWQMERGFTTPGDILVQQLRLFRLQEADALGTYSEEGAVWLRRRLPGKPVITLGNALDTRRMAQASANAKPVRRGSPQLLGVGRLTADKRFDLLIDVFRGVRAEHPLTVLTIVGDGPERSRLEQLAGADLGKGIVLTGALHEEPQLAPHFLGADVLIVPGAAGLSVNHALAYHLPVAAFGRSPNGPRHHPEIEYVVEGESGLLVASPDPAEMVKRISGAVASGELANLRLALHRKSPAPAISDVVERFQQLIGVIRSSGSYGP